MYLRESPNGAKQLGVIADSSAAVCQGGGEFGCLAEVVFLVLWRLVVDA